MKHISKTTDEFENEFKMVKNDEEIKEYVSKLNKLDAGGYLQKLLEQKSKKVSDIIAHGNISSSQVYKFINGERGISRDKILIISCSIGLSVEETNNLLKISGFNKLYIKDKRDSLIIYGLERNKSSEDIEMLLSDNGIEFKLI